MKVTRAKNPIKLAKEMLIRGEADDGGGAQQHCQLHGDICDELAEKWGLELVDPSYYWTRRRWDEHRKGLGLCHDDETYNRDKQVAGRGGDRDDNSIDVGLVTNDPSWDGKEYLPQGTVGTVVLDSTGTLCVATSTGGITNKLPGRIGDTPTLGAGRHKAQHRMLRHIANRRYQVSGQSNGKRHMFYTQIYQSNNTRRPHLRRCSVTVSLP